MLIQILTLKYNNKGFLRPAARVSFHRRSHTGGLRFFCLFLYIYGIYVAGEYMYCNISGGMPDKTACVENIVVWRRA